MPLIPFATKSAGNKGYSGERLVNWFLRPTDGLSKASLIGRSGSVRVADVGGPVRAVFAFQEKLHAIANGKIFRFEGSDLTTIGTINNSENVSVAVNSNEFAVVAGNAYYVSDGQSTTEVETGAVDVPTWVAFFRGFMVPVGSDGFRDDKLTVSGLDDARTFDLLDFAFAESATDGLIAAFEMRDQLWLFGKNSIEIWYLSGAADFPLAPVLGRTIRRGCISALTIAEEDNALFWVGEDKVVYRGVGGAPAVISTREVEGRLREGEVYSGFTFEDQGHKFYALRLRTGATLVYDITTNLWHERTTGNQGAAWFATCATRVAGQQYFGTDTGVIVTLDHEIYTDDGDEIIAEAVSVPIYDPDGVYPGRVHVVAGGNGAGQIMMQTSDDGHIWSQEEWRDLGGTGAYQVPAEWQGLGRFERFQVRLRISDPVPRDLHGVHYGL